MHCIVIFARAKLRKFDVLICTKPFFTYTLFLCIYGGGCGASEVFQHIVKLRVIQNYTVRAQILHILNEPHAIEALHTRCDT